MGLNSTTFVPAYTSGEVLTAADLTVTNSGVPVFADTTARDAAFGGTGEKVLAEGQMAYVENLDVVQYFDGSVWATVGPAAPSGFNFVTGASFTTVASVSLPNDTFDGTYRNYKLILQLTAAASNANVTGRFRDGGSDISTATYYQGSPGFNGSLGTASNQGDNGTTSFTLGSISSTFPEYGVSLDFLAPFAAGGDKIALGNLRLTDVGRAVSLRLYDAGKTLTVDSFTFLFSANCTGVYRVYGYSDS